MISRKNLDELIEAYTEARNRVSTISYDLEDLSTEAGITTWTFREASADIIRRSNDLYWHINTVINILHGITPTD